LTAQEPTRPHHQDHPTEFRGFDAEASPDEAAAEWLCRLDEALKKLEAAE